MNTGATRERRERVSLLPFIICRSGFSPDGRARFRPPVRSRLGEAGRTETGMEPKALGGGGRVMSAGRVCDMDSEPQIIFALLRVGQSIQRLAAARRFPSASVPVRANTLAL